MSRAPQASVVEELTQTLSRVNDDQLRQKFGSCSAEILSLLPTLGRELFRKAPAQFLESHTSEQLVELFQEPEEVLELTR